MTDYGASDTSTTVLGNNQFPISEVFVPNGTLTALEGGPSSTDLSGKKSAPASMYVKDGGDVAQGTTTDAAYSGSGAGTTIALLKKLVAELAATLTVSGAVTANAGTNLNTSTLALESGGNLASAKADLDSIVTNTTGIATQATLASVKTNLDTLVTNTADLLADGDNLATIATNTGNIPAKGQATMANSLPATLASNQTGIGTLASPNINEAWIENAIRNAKAFHATTGNLVTATNTNLTVCAMSIFNASNSGKSILIYSIEVGGTHTSGFGANRLVLTTTDPSGGTGYTGAPISTNLSAGGAAPGASLSCSPTSIAASPTFTGTNIKYFALPQASLIELLGNNKCILLPSGSANGISVAEFITTVGDNFMCNISWVEF